MITQAYREYTLKLEKALSRTYPRLQWEVLGREGLPVEANGEQNFVVQAGVAINDVWYIAQTTAAAEVVYRAFHKSLAMIVSDISWHIVSYICAKV